jgi:hypothetical protein
MKTLTLVFCAILTSITLGWSAVSASRDMPQALNLSSAKSATGGSAKSANPVRTEQVVKFTHEIPAGTLWDSAVRLGELCADDLRVEFDDKFTTYTFDRKEVIFITIKDTYTNLRTGFKFVDNAWYQIHHDFTTHKAFHIGVFFWTTVDGRPKVRDAGTFTQTWIGPFPWPVENPTGPFNDVKGVPFGTRSYCDWSVGIFP